MTPSNSRPSPRGYAARQPVKTAEPDDREAGVVLTDLSLSPLAVDSGAVAILHDINRRDGLEHSNCVIPREISEAFLNLKGDRSRGMLVTVRGQKYEYICSMYQV